MQPKQPKQNRISLYSRFSKWCAVHRIPILLFPIAILFLAAVAVLIIGGTVLNWNIAGILTSPTSILIYVILFLVSFAYLYHRVMKDR